MINYRHSDSMTLINRDLWAKVANDDQLVVSECEQLVNASHQISNRSFRSARTRPISSPPVIGFLSGVKYQVSIKLLSNQSNTILGS